MRDEDIHEVIKRLKKAVRSFQVPIVTEMAEEKRSPYELLISTIISLRTKDKVTAEASRSLFSLADSPARMIKLKRSMIAKAIYPAGFYKTKAATILDVSRRLLDEYDGRVPDDIDELLKFKGVGRKTANLVVTLGYDKPGICVDIHVHRISNRLGYVQAPNPEKTEFALREKLPRKYWITYNDLLVAYGQNLCKPTSPFCSRCTLAEFCDRAGVVRSR